MERFAAVFKPLFDFSGIVHTAQGCFHGILGALIFVDEHTLLDRLPLVPDRRVDLIPLYLEIGGENIKNLFRKLVHPRKDSRIL